MRIKLIEAFFHFSFPIYDVSSLLFLSSGKRQKKSSFQFIKNITAFKHIFTWQAINSSLHKHAALKSSNADLNAYHKILRTPFFADLIDIYSSAFFCLLCLLQHFFAYRSKQPLSSLSLEHQSDNYEGNWVWDSTLVGVILSRFGVLTRKSKLALNMRSNC